MESNDKHHYNVQRPKDKQLAAVRGKELVTPFRTEDGLDLGAIGRRYYSTFALNWIDIHSERPYAFGLGMKEFPPSIIIAEAYDCCQGIMFNTPGTSHNMYSGRQTMVNLRNLSDGVSYDMNAHSRNKGRMVSLTHQQIARLAERYPDRVEGFWRMLERFDNNRAVDALRTPLQQNCLNTIFAQPLLGNMTEEFANDQIATYLSTLAPKAGTEPRALHKIRNTALLRSKMQDVKTMIDSAPPTPFTLHRIALSVGTNENYLKAAFRYEYGISVFGYIFERRMLLATQLLRDTDFSIDQIALAVGYTETPNFHVAFRRRFGSTPTAYRIASRKTALRHLG